MKRNVYPPGPKCRWPGENYLAFYRDPLGFLTRVAQAFGDIVHMGFFNRHHFLLNDPGYIKEVLLAPQQEMNRSTPQAVKELLGKGLLTSQGEFHQRQRRLFQPAFHKERIAGYGFTMVEFAARAAEPWRDGETRDIAQEMMRLTMAIALKVLFSADAEAEAHRLSKFLTAALEATAGGLPFVSGLLAAFHPRRKRRFQWGRKGLEETICRLIVQRRNSARRPPDLLSMMLELQETEPAMTDQQVRDELMTFFVAGHESTSNALTWTWYLLGEHPDLEARFHAELDAVLGRRLPTVDDLPRLPYARMVLSESLRLYPPLWIVARRPWRDMEIGGYRIPARSHLFMSPWVMHRHPRYYPHAERFDPERWLPEAVASRAKFCYFPFGGGPRQCIGEGFGWTEGVLLMATIGQRWRMRLVPEQRVEPEPLITLRPKYGMRMTLHQR